MGWDFIALLKYEGLTPNTLAEIGRLEHRSPPELRACIKEFRKEKYTPGGLGRTWEDRKGDPLGKRPRLPTTRARFWTPEAFAFTFGRDVLLVYQSLRWSIFLEEPRLRRAVLKACAALCDRFRALDCIITRDASPIIIAFHEGAHFDEALRAGGRREKEVRAINGLWIDKGESKTLIMGGGQKIRIWDSRGYWRFRWKKGAPPLGKAPWLVRKHKFTPGW